jgi:hypothetical protein
MRKISRAEEMNAKKTLRRLAKTNQAPDAETGVLDFNYVQFIEASDGTFNYASDVSTCLNTLDTKGTIKKVRRGTSGTPSRWDVSEFIANDTAAPVELQVEKTKESVPAPKEIVTEEPVFTTQLAPVSEPVTETTTEVVAEDTRTDEETVTIGEVRETVRGMAEYLAETQREMIHELNRMVSRLTIVDPERVDALQAEILDIGIERDKLVTENRRLTTEAEAARAEADKKEPEVNINKHVIYRNRNQIMDEMERWINIPGWQKQSKAEHFRKTISAKLAEIMREAGVEEGV